MWDESALSAVSYDNRALRDDGDTSDKWWYFEALLLVELVEVLFELLVELL